MFKLEEAIANWRRSLGAGGVHSSAVMDELESHLREEIQALISSGTPEVDAFRAAESRLGDPEALSAEFQKIDETLPITLWARVILGSGILLTLATVLLAARFPGKPGPLLLVHILILSVGDITALVAGALGICYIAGLGLNRLSSAEKRSLSRAATFCNQFAAFFVMTGLLLGTVLNLKDRGHYLSADPREFGTLCATLWLVTLCLIHRFARTTVHTTMLLCVAGNLIICLGWFGAGIVSQSYGIFSYWQLNTALVINLVFLAWGVVPRFIVARS